MRFNLLATTAAAAAFGGFIGVAHAADLTPAPTAVDWTGFYIGAHIGYGEAYMSGCIDCGDVSSSKGKDLNLDGVTGGLHAGYNWQSDRIVLGLEGDISANDWSDDVFKDPGDGQTDGQKANVDWLASVRARLGYAVDDALIYATGGVAFSDAEWTDIDKDSLTDRHKSAHFNDVGGVVGGGVEYMAFENVSLRAEGLYYFFNEDKSVSNFPRGGSGEQISFDDAWVARVGVTFHFK